MLQNRQPMASGVRVPEGGSVPVTLIRDNGLVSAIIKQFSPRRNPLLCHEHADATIDANAGIATSDVAFTSDGQTIPAMLASPVGSTDKSPVVLFHDIWGVNDFYRDFARRMAMEGYPTLLPDFFVRQKPLAEPTREAVFARRAQMDQEQAVRDLGAAIQFMEERAGMPGTIGIAGFCLGGTYVLLAAARDPLPRAVVSFYGFPAGHDGWPLKPLDETSDVRAPILFQVGDLDAGVGMDNVELYTSQVTEAGGSIETIIYPGTPHGFMTFDPENPSFEAASAAWQRMTNFLDAPGS